MLQRGLSEAVASAIVRFQLEVQIVFQHGECESHLGPRYSGAMTGTRVAGWLGRVLVADVLIHANADPLLIPMDVSGLKFSFATWVDNVYAISHSAEAAVQNICIFGRHLQSRWKLKLKPGSLKLISAAGPRSLSAKYKDFVWQEPLVVLGHCVERDGRFRSDYIEAVSCAWVRYYVGAGSKRGRRLPCRLRLRDVGQTVWPALNCRTAWWAHPGFGVH